MSPARSVWHACSSNKSLPSHARTAISELEIAISSLWTRTRYTRIGAWERVIEPLRSKGCRKMTQFMINHTVNSASWDFQIRPTNRSAFDQNLTQNQISLVFDKAKTWKRLCSFFHLFHFKCFLASVPLPPSPLLAFSYCLSLLVKGDRIWKASSKLRDIGRNESCHMWMQYDSQITHISIRHVKMRLQTVGTYGCVLTVMSHIHDWVMSNRHSLPWPLVQENNATPTLILHPNGCL